MNWPYLHLPLLETLSRFFETGGTVLVFIAGVALLLWTLIFERFIYFHVGHARVVRSKLATWPLRNADSAWHTRHLKAQLFSEVSQSLERNLPLIRVCVKLALLLGLLGTVSGMTQVFEALAMGAGSNSGRIAIGFSHATIPTMAGMVVSLSGLGFSAWLSARAEREKNRFRKLLTATISHKLPPGHEEVKETGS